LHRIPASAKKGRHCTWKFACLVGYFYIASAGPWFWTIR